MSGISRRALVGIIAVAALVPGGAQAADALKEIHLDWATYNPVSMILKQRGLLEKEFAKDGIGIVWVQSAGSNKALEFLNAGSIDFGSTAGSAALVAKGKTALVRGDVDAWAGLDPMMAQAEIEDGAKLFFRKPDANTWGILNVRETFLKEHPDIVRRVLAAYEEARKYSVANYDELKKTFIGVTKLPEAVVDKQLKDRTELTHSRIGAPQRESMLAAGLALQQAGVIDAKVNVKATLDALIDDQVPLPTN